MNGKSWLACVALATLGIANSAHADGGTVNFQGAITEPTCGLQQSGLQRAELVSNCPGTKGPVSARVRLHTQFGAVMSGANHASLTLKPVLQDGVALRDTYVAQVQYL